MSDTNVRVIFTGNSAGAVRASDRAADSIKKIGREGREAAHGVDEIRERAEAGTRAINEERRALERLKVASLLGGAATGAKWGLMAGGIAALGTAAIGTTAALAPLAGSVAVIPGLMTAAGLALGTVKLAMDNVAKAAGGNKKALAELTPAGREFVKTLQSFEPVIDRLRTTAQKGLFPGLLDALDKLKTPAVFAVLNKAVGQMAKSLGGVASQFGKVIGSQKFLQTFSVVAQAAAHWMQQFGTFAVKGFDAMVSLTKAAIPLTNWMGDLSVRFATFLDNQIKAASASGKLQSFFAGVRQQITLIGRTLGSLGSALVSVFKLAVPFGNALFVQLAKGADAVKKFADSAQGHAAITAFFASVGNALRGLAPIAGALLAGIANVLPHLLNALGNLGRALGPALVPMIRLTARALSGLLDVVNRLARGMGTSISRAVAQIVPEMRRVEVATKSMASTFRTTLPGISVLASAQTAKMRSDLHSLAAVFNALGPVVRALAPVFRVAFAAAAVAVRIQAFWLTTLVKAEVAVIHGLIAAIHAIGDAWHWLEKVASHVINFKIHVPHISFPSLPSWLHRAGGGFLPGAPGSPVPVIAHAGEVILNRAQQDMLGGPRMIARMFGFRGDEGPGFAGGGFVRAKWKQKKAPHRKIGARAMATSRAGKAAEAAANAVYVAEGDLDTTFDLLRRQYEISPDQYGNALDIGEIDSLIAERGRMLALIEQEKQKLQVALEVLKKAVAQLVAAIKAENDAIKADLLKLRDERRKKKDKHGKGGPNQKTIHALEGDLSSRRTRLGTLQKELGEVRGDVTKEKRRLDPDLGFDRRKVELDIMEFQQMRVDTLKSIAEAQASGDSGGGGDFGGGSDFGGGFGGGFGGTDQSALIQQLTEELGKLRLTLAVQGVQVPIIGSFQHGVLSVPETGLAMVHAGEQITPAGRPSVGGGPAGDVTVNVHLNGDLEKLAHVIDARVDVNVPHISNRIGQMSDRRRRSGRF